MRDKEYQSCDNCYWENMDSDAEPCCRCKSTALYQSDEFKKRPFLWQPKRYQIEPFENNVNHPAHYQGKHECIDEMVALFGKEAVKHFCMCNVYKYRFRAANKNGEEDLDKADWYMDKLMELEGEADD